MLEVIDQYGQRHRFDDRHCIHSEAADLLQIGMTSDEGDYEVVATFPHPARYGLVSHDTGLVLREEPEGVVRQMEDLRREREKVNELANRCFMAEAVIAGDGALLSGLQNDLADAQTTIAQMREALENVADNVCERMVDRGTVIEGVNFAALQVGIRKTIAIAATANRDALHEALARECERLAGQLRAAGQAGFADWLADEAAAHRARRIL